MGPAQRRALCRTVERLAGSLVREGMPAAGAFARAVEMVCQAAAGAVDGPGEAISLIYSVLLRYRPEVDGRFVLAEDPLRRRGAGAFYTPPHLAALVVDAALEPLPGPVRVLDPAMGTGIFLVMAARALARRGLEPGWVAERCLFGVDLDPLAVRLAVLALCAETRARPEVVGRHLRCADALMAMPFDGEFDAVVGNPPWGALLSGEARAQVGARFPAVTGGAIDSFKLFADLASARSRGTVGLVLPQAVLAQATHADVRALLLERKEPRWAAWLGNDAFAGAAAPACALVFGARPGPGRVQIHDPVREWGFSVPAAEWTAQRFSLARPERGTMLRRLGSRFPALGDLEEAVRVRDPGMNYNRAAVARRVLYRASEPEDGRDHPTYRGRDFGRYTPVRPGGWLRHDAARRLEPGEVLTLGWSTYRLPCKIVLRQTADRIVATLDTTHMVMGRSVLALTAEEPGMLPALLACLNSGLLSGLYRTMAQEEGRVLPQVKVGCLRLLPLPQVEVPPPDLVRRAGEALLGGRVPADAEEPGFAWACLDVLGRRLLGAGGADAAREALVDGVVCLLYGVTAREAAWMGAK